MRIAFLLLPPGMLFSFQCHEFSFHAFLALTHINTQSFGELGRKTVVPLEKEKERVVCVCMFCICKCTPHPTFIKSTVLLNIC